METQFTDQNFNSEVINISNEKPVLVDFFASWCGPCKMQASIIKEISKEIGEKAVVGKINVEESQETAQKYNVMGVPTILLFKNGEVKETLIGMQPKEILIELINKYL